MTDELKKAFENAKTEEEKKAVVEKFKDELQQLSDEELKEVAGGAVAMVATVRKGESGAGIRKIPPCR